MTEPQLRRWHGVIAGEPASKANSRQIVKIAGRLRVIKSLKARRYVAEVARQVAPLPADKQLRAPIAMTAHVFYATERPDLDPSLIPMPCRAASTRTTARCARCTSSITSTASVRARRSRSSKSKTDHRRGET